MPQLMAEAQKVAAAEREFHLALLQATDTCREKSPACNGGRYDPTPSRSCATGHAKDHEFSGTSMREHWQSGYEDTKRTLRRKDWVAMPPHGDGIIVHDVHREDDH
jgi:hypothetical protein